MGAASAARGATMMSHRMRIALAFMAVVLLVMGLRLFHVQGLDTSGYAQAAVSERLRSVPVPAERGDILDAQGRVMATSVDRYDLIVDQRLVDDFRERNEDTGLMTTVSIGSAIDELAAIVDEDPDTLAERMTGDAHYAVVAESVTPDEQERAMEIGIPGLYSEQVPQRSYPSGPVAGSILGFMGEDGPLEGVESVYDGALSGQDGERVYEIGASGVRIPTATYEEIPAEDGQDVQLTIDQDLQWFAQEAIAQKTNQYNAQWGNATVVDLESGEILAMADSETVDPFAPGETEELFRRPLALTQDFEPGSSGKALTFAAAMEEGTMSPTDEFTVPDEYTVEGETIQDARPHEDYEMTAAGIFARSYNTGTVMIGNELDEQTRYEYMRDVGLGEPIDIGLGIDGESILRPPDEWDRRQPLSTQFGQGYTSTVLHTVQQYQTLANDGVHVPLSIVDSYVDSEGDAEPYEAGEPHRIFSSETSEEMMRMLEGVVQYGSAPGAAIEGYRVGGKTGSAEAAGESGGFDGYTMSFVGVAPLDDPQYLVSVAVHRPQGEWGDWEVTDTFQQIMSHTLSTYNVPPSGAEEESYDGFVGDNQDQAW